MKKKLALLLALALAATAAGTVVEVKAASDVTEATEASETTGKYTVYNDTGATVTELYLYEAGNEKGENYAVAKDHEEGLEDGSKLELTYDGSEDTVLTLEFTTEDGTTSTFETLHIETAPISLITVDANSGATPISFSVPQETGTYTVYNTTGQAVTELYLYPVDSEEKGDNYAADGLADGENTELSYTGDVDSVLVLEYVTEDGTDSSFETLHVETVPISLITVDASSGATPISFTEPEE